jgi:hypothetical protein
MTRRGRAPVFRARNRANPLADAAFLRNVSAVAAAAVAVIAAHTRFAPAAPARAQIPNMTVAQLAFRVTSGRGTAETVKQAMELITANVSAAPLGSGRRDAGAAMQQRGRAAGRAAVWFKSQEWRRAVLCQRAAAPVQGASANVPAVGAAAFRELRRRHACCAGAVARIAGVTAAPPRAEKRRLSCCCFDKIRG